MGPAAGVKTTVSPPVNRTREPVRSPWTSEREFAREPVKRSKRGPSRDRYCESLPMLELPELEVVELEIDDLVEEFVVFEIVELECVVVVELIVVCAPPVPAAVREIATVMPA